MTDMLDEELRKHTDRFRLLGFGTSSEGVESGIGRAVRETLNAFSQSDGGTLIIGLSETQGFIPVEDFDPQSAQSQLMSRCEQMTPVVRPGIEILKADDALALVAEIPEMQSLDKPCYVIDQGRYGGSYKRTGDGDMRMTQYEVDHLIEQKTQPKWGEEPIDDAPVDDPDSSILTPFLQSERIERPKTFAHGEDLALTRLRITRQEHPTLAALLAMNEYPQEFFPRLTVTWAMFPGTSKGEITTGTQLLNSATVTDPTPELVERTLGLVARNMQTGALIGERFRTELPDYPLVAMREAIIDTLMHHDYSPAARGTQVQVSLFVDRLKITGLGGLYGNTTLATLEAAGTSATHNQRLATFLENVALANGGIITRSRDIGIQVIQAALREALMPLAEFENDLAQFTVVFRRRRIAQAEQCTTALEAVRAILINRESVSARDLVRATRLSRTSVQNFLNSLTEDDVTEATEPPKGPRQRYRHVLPERRSKSGGAWTSFPLSMPATSHIGEFVGMLCGKFSGQCLSLISELIHEAPGMIFHNADGRQALR